MKIATWNVNSIRTRLEQVSQWLQTNPVDVLCLQETKVVDADFPMSPLQDLGYHVYVFGQKSYNGVAILSQTPLTNLSLGFASIIGDNDYEEQKRLIAGTCNGIRIINVYVPNGAEVGSDKYIYKLNWLNHLGEYLKISLDKNPDLCICGDFNIAPDDRDIHNPTIAKNSVMASEPERQALQELLNLGLQDAFRKFTTEGGYFSWWDYRARAFERNKGWRIDHHYLSANLYEKCISCTIDKSPRQLSKPSDHTPAIAEFSL